MAKRLYIKSITDLMIEAANRAGAPDIVERAEILIGLAEKTLFNRLHVKGREPPSLTAVNSPSIWLFQEEPELYLQAVLLQIYIAIGEIEKARLTSAYLEGLIEEFNLKAYEKNHGGKSIRLSGVNP